MPISESADIKPEIIAAISASIEMIMKDASAEMVAAIAAAIVHAASGGRAVRFKRTSNAWANLGRQKIMDSRL